MDTILLTKIIKDYKLEHDIVFEDDLEEFVAMRDEILRILRIEKPSRPIMMVWFDIDEPMIYFCEEKDIIKCELYPHESWTINKRIDFSSIDTCEFKEILEKLSNKMQEFMNLIEKKIQQYCDEKKKVMEDFKQSSIYLEYANFKIKERLDDKEV